MAMAFALAGLRAAGVRIENPACTAKTYPDYFNDLSAAVGRPSA
jgi:3-phosphoshikimate 1-carboxyvinyltransferase